MNAGFGGKDRLDTFTDALFASVFVLAIYSLVTTPMEMGCLTDIASYIALIVAPVAVLLNPMKSPHVSAGIFALAVSVYNITYSVTYFELEVSIFNFVTGAIYAMLGLNLLVGSVLFIRGASKNVTVMVYAAACSMGLEIFFFAFSLHRGTDPLYLLDIYAGSSLVAILANVSVITLLSTDEIKRQTLAWRMDAALSGAQAVLGVDPASFMYREDMERVLSWFERPDAPGYSDVKVTSEIRVPIVCPNARVHSLAFQRYPGRAVTVLVLDGDGSFARGSAVRVHTVSPNRPDGYGNVRFYGDGGVFINILVKDPEPKKGPWPFRRADGAFRDP